MRKEMLTVIRGEPIDIETFYQSLSQDIREHSEAVGRLAEQIFQWSSDEYVREIKECPDLRSIERAARYHDIGFSLIPDRVYCKDGELTGAEYRVLQQHAIYGGRLLDSARKKSTGEAGFWGLAAEIALAHHERWDGKGYPYGQSTTAISLAARIVSIADAFDSMVRGSHYRMKLPPEFAMVEIIQNAGKQFDPFLVELFRKHYDMVAAIMCN